METSTMEQGFSTASPSALHVHAIKTPTFNDDGIAQCSDDDDIDFAKLNICDKTIPQDPMTHRFFGKSSGVVLLQTAIDLKNEYSGLPLDPPLKKPMVGLKRPEFWNVRPVSNYPLRRRRAFSHLML
jgi:hypothetical protein